MRMSSASEDRPQFLLLVFVLCCGVLWYGVVWCVARCNVFGRIQSVTSCCIALYRVVLGSVMGQCNVTCCGVV